MKTAFNYKYISLKEANSHVNKKVNIIAIVLEYGLPKKTKGPDYCSVVRVIDESHHEFAMAVNVFCDDTNKLPHVLAPGDVIHFCHVTVKKRNREVNVVFNKRFSSFALYKGEGGDDFVPYQVSPKFHPGDQDNVYIDNLRKWLVNVPLYEDRKDYHLFREFKEGCPINLACKIIHCGEIAKDEWFIFVWDGTDTPSNTLHAKPENELSCPLPLQLEPSPLSRDLLCTTFPAIGSVLRIYFQQTIEKSYLNLLNNIKWVKFVNLNLEVHSGLWCGVFTSYSRIRYTPAEDSLILERQRLFAERMSLRSKIMPCGSFPLPSHFTVLPEEYDHIPYLTLMDVLTYSEVTAKFKCVVRVVAALPCQAEMLRAPSGTYRMRLTLEDPTARIHALVVAEDGETLFDGYPSTESLTKKLNILLGVTECFDDDGQKKGTVRNPPWVGVCLMSYYGSEDDKWGTRHFRIFDTRIVEDDMMMVVF